MKEYNLLKLDKATLLGKIKLSDDFTKIKIDVSPLVNDKYLPVLSRAVTSVGIDIVNLSVKENYSEILIDNSNKDFWAAFKQYLFLNLNILVAPSGDSDNK